MAIEPTRTASGASPKPTARASIGRLTETIGFARWARAHRRVIAVGAWAAVFGYLCWGNLATGFVIEDETWVMQVVERMRSGEVLYRDIEFDVTPLTAHLHRWLTEIFGNEVFVLRGANAFVRTMTLVIGAGALRRLGVGKLGTFVFVGAGLVYSRPMWNLYVTVAHLAVVACLALTLRWWDRAPPSGSRARWLTFAAGAVAGLAFASKQNIGIFVALALALGIVAADGPMRVRLVRLVTSGLGFFAVVGPVLTQIWASGGWAKFLEYGFLNRGTYLDAVGTSFLDSIKDIGYAARDGVTRVEWLNAKTALVLLPLAAAVLLVSALGRSLNPDRLRAVVVGAFAAASVLDAYPDAGFWRFNAFAPVLLLAIVYGFHSLKLRPTTARRLAAAAAAVWVGWWVAYVPVASMQLAAKDAYGASRTDHLRGAIVSRVFDETVARADAALTAAAPSSQPMFIRHAFAGLLYLVTPIDNPTPYDIPSVVTAGLQHGQDIVDAIAAGRIRTVCYAPTRQPRHNLVLLEEYLTTSLVAAGDMGGICTLYRRPDDRGAAGAPAGRAVARPGA
jgi:hypothetical protein